MIHLTVPIVFIILGLILYGFTTNKAAEIGKLLLFCGLLAVAMKGLP